MPTRLNEQILRVPGYFATPDARLDALHICAASIHQLDYRPRNLWHYSKLTTYP